MKTSIVIVAIAVCSVLLFIGLRRLSGERQIVFNPPATQTEPLPNNEFPFDHPAAERARQLFLSLRVTSEDKYRVLPLRERFLVDIKALESEVMNGGIDQYMWNSSGDHALECVEALDAIGAKEAHSFLQNACKLFPEHRPASIQEVRQAQLRNITVGKQTLDDLVDGGLEFELYELLLKYWDSHEPAK